MSQAPRRRSLAVSSLSATLVDLRAAQLTLFTLPEVSE